VLYDGDEEEYWEELLAEPKFDDARAWYQKKGQKERYKRYPDQLWRK
jgi:hypothetical protein